MSNEFSYYFNGVRQTRTDVEFLQELTRDCENQQDVIHDILESKKRHIEQQQLNGV